MDFSNNWATEEDAALVNRAQESISTFVDDVITPLPAYYNMIALPAEATEIRRTGHNFDKRTRNRARLSNHVCRQRPLRGSASLDGVPGGAGPAVERRIFRPCRGALPGGDL